MNIRCSFCQIPFAIGRNEMLAALQHMEAEKLNHYDAQCPRCRRATPIVRARLEMANPNWRDSFKAMEADMAAHPQQEAPLSKPEPASVPETESTPEPKLAKEPKASSPKRKTRSKKSK